MKERLQKILSARGVASRRKAEQWLLDGRVTVNGIKASIGDSADPEQDRILVDGKPLPDAEHKIYLMLNKPRGFVTTLSDEMGRPTVAELVSGCGQRVYPVGRLDYDSEGLLLLTNDGDFANALMHPKKEVNKTYLVWVSGFHEAATSLVSRSIVLDGYRIRPPKVKLLRFEGDRAKFQITIHEGRNRQIRRMCEAAGMSVTRLRRIKEGTLSLGNLKSGTWRYLTEEELAEL